MPPHPTRVLRCPTVIPAAVGEAKEKHWFLHIIPTPSRLCPSHSLLLQGVGQCGWLRGAAWAWLRAGVRARYRTQGALGHQSPRGGAGSGPAALRHILPRRQAPLYKVRFLELSRQSLTPENLAMPHLPPRGETRALQGVANLTTV